MKHKVKITKEMLEKFISDTGTELTLEEIESLMNSEAEKSADEMDTELIDLCAAVLAKAYNPDFREEKPSETYRPWEDEKNPVSEAEDASAAKPKKKKTVKFRRVLLVAAVLAAVFAVALPVGAKLFGNKASDGIIGFYTDFFKINMSQDEPTTANEDDTVNQMIPESLDTFMLPEALLSEDYEKKVETKQNEQVTVILISVNNEDQDISGLITITQYKSAEHSMTNGFGNIPEDTYRYFKKMLIDNKELIVFGDGDISYINYSDGATNYQISLSCDFDTMISIAETISVKG
ncbi:MAG: hypothetical protein IJA87_07980 [Clostridia bacterium]|nr:hypothetical protein [Clostridia bacterium]